ncbi:MAG: metallophosphoesterase family protein [Ideonella sp.]|nr:metallophosphoesterase family protein [Ideonella sp.]MCC7458009.1 metallophosphoesterase family protein [Nitrospira sp.]
MKLNILSDLHLGFGAMDWPVNDADVVVLAGDISRPREAVAWALRFERPVLYVPGNHEFYGGSLDGTVQELQRLCAGTPVRLLDRDEVILSGVRFLGATLWSDFALFADPQQCKAAKAEAQRFMRDFSRIRTRADSDEIFTPDDSAALFRRDADWLRGRLAAPHAGTTVVITHHAPSRRSIHPRFTESLLNAGFVSDAEDLLGADRVALWIHGHTHDSFDYHVHGTRVICNPRGYARDGVNENSAFDANRIVELDAGHADRAR